MNDPALLCPFSCPCEVVEGGPRDFGRYHCPRCMRCVPATTLARSAYRRGRAELEAVATEAAAMLAETNHGGLTHARSESMRKALVAAGVEVPARCSECPDHENMREAPKAYCACGAPSCDVCHP